MNDGVNEIAESIGEGMTLASFDFLAYVIAPWASGFRGFDTLAVYHASARPPLLRLARHQ